MQSCRQDTLRKYETGTETPRLKGPMATRPVPLAITWIIVLALSWPLTSQAQQDNGDDPEEPPSLEELGSSERPQGGTMSQEPIFIDFRDVSLLDLIDAISVKTGKNFEVEPNLANQKVTIISNQAVPVKMAYDLLEAILAGRNLIMLDTLDGNLIRIVNRVGQVGTDKLHIYKGTIPPLDGFDRFSIHVVNIRYADATEVAELLKRVGSEANEITAYPQTNLLIIKDTADGVRNMMTLLEMIDVPGTGASVEIFTLEYTRAEALSQQIQEVLLGDEGTVGQRGSVPQRPAATRAVRTARTPAVPGQAQADVIGQGEETLRMVPDERLNALIVVASEGLMEQTRFLIEQLDTPTPFEANNMHYVELLNADAEDVVAALDAITSTAPRQGGQAGGQTGEVQPFEKDIIITSYEQTNALLILATPQDFKLLKNMIDHLDVPRRQVNVEAVIMEVTINDGISLSVELAGLESDDFFALSNAVSLASSIAGGPTAFAGLGGTLGILSGTTEIPAPTTVDPDATISIPTVPLLIRTLEQITDVEVLSRPNLLSVDNTLAEITVGQDIPIVSSLADTDDRTGFSSRSQVARRDVGVSMKVTPQINEGDYVYMEIEVEVSAAVESTVNIDDTSQGGATIQQALITNEVVVGDGQTGIIGGLIRETRAGSVSQIPLLGDLPLIGWLFRSKSKTRMKQNLVVLITPHVIKRGDDFERISRHRMEEFYQSNLDAVFEKGGVIKTMKNKHRQRKKRPTDQYNPNVNQGQNFGRSKIQR